MAKVRRGDGESGGMEKAFKSSSGDGLGVGMLNALSAI
jgi:hypothetical protein